MILEVAGHVVHQRTIAEQDVTSTTETPTISRSAVSVVTHMSPDTASWPHSSRQTRRKPYTVAGIRSDTANVCSVSGSGSPSAVQSNSSATPYSIVAYVGDVVVHSTVNDVEVLPAIETPEIAGEGGQVAKLPSSDVVAMPNASSALTR